MACGNRSWKDRDLKRALIPRRGYCRATAVMSSKHGKGRTLTQKGKGLNSGIMLSALLAPFETQSREQSKRNDAPLQIFLLGGKARSRPAETLENSLCGGCSSYPDRNLALCQKHYRRYIFNENTKQTPSLVWSFGLTTSHCMIPSVLMCCGT